MEKKVTENPVVKDMLKDTAASVQKSLVAQPPVKVEKTVPKPAAKKKPAAKPPAKAKKPAGTTAPKKVTPKKKAKSKKTPASSLKKLEKWAIGAKTKAHEVNALIKKLEQEANAGAVAVRKLVGKPTDKLSVFGHSNHGMAARMDDALMKFNPSDFSKILVHVASGDNTARRSGTTEHDKMVTHLLNHLKRCSGNGSMSEFKFKKPLTKVNLDKQSSVICDHLKPVLRLLQAYVSAGAPKKVAKKPATTKKTVTKKGASA